jgi:hypothetical protein
MVLEDTRELFQNDIREKARLLPRYLERCDRCWLVLAADAARPSSFIEPNQASLAHTYESPFERTYFLDCSQGRPVQLATRAPAKWRA